LSTNFASVTFNTGKFTLLPGQSHQVVATITPPKGVDATTFPVYSGFIDVTSGNETVHATYLGLAASLKDAQVVDNTDIIFGIDLPALLDSQGNVQDGPLNYTFVGDDAPTLLWRQAFGTPLFRVDLVSPNIQLTGTLNTRAPISFANPHNGGSFAKVPTLGALFEIPYLTRNDEVSMFLLWNRRKTNHVGLCRSLIWTTPNSSHPTHSPTALSFPTEATRSCSALFG
jgi:hypothetical protein